MKSSMFSRAAGIIAATVLIVSGATGAAIATASPTNEWASQFSSTHDLQLTGVTSEVGSPANVNFIGDDETLQFAGTQEGDNFVVEFNEAVPVGRYQVTLSNMDNAADYQEVGYYTALTLFEAEQIYDDMHPIEVGQTTKFFVSLPVSGSDIGDYGDMYQSGLSAVVRLPENIVVVDPATGTTSSGTVEVPLAWDGVMYTTTVHVKPIALGSEPIKVEVWKGDVQVGVPTPMTPNFVDDKTVASTPINLEIIDGAASAATSSIEVVDGHIGQYANGVASHRVLIHARNAQGYTTSEPLTDLMLTANPSDGVTFGPVEPTGTTGEYQATFTSTTAGIKVIGASAGGVTIDPVEGANTALFVPGPAVASASTLSGTTGVVLADGKATHSATVTVRDAQNRPVPGATVTFDADTKLTATAPGVNGERTGTITAVTNDQGQAIMRFTSKSLGKFAVSATVDGETVHGSPVFFEYGAVPTADKGDADKGGKQAVKPVSQLAKTGGSIGTVLALLSLFAGVGVAAAVVSRRSL